MRRTFLILLCAFGIAGALAAAAGADDERTYEIEMYNAFGVVEGSEVRVAGVTVGTVDDLTVNADKRAVVTVTMAGELAELGDETTCSTAPQSLIAEYFIDCEPAGDPLPDGGTVPASRVTQTVQPDLVQNTLREPFKLRLQLLLNEFGTALAGNSEHLNEAIRLGAPALAELKEVTGILASQRDLIRDLNVDSDKILGELEAFSEEIVAFVDEAEDAGAASAERRDDLARDFELLDDLMVELEPTLAELDHAAREQTPLLTDLREAAPGLNRLAEGLPPFNRATEVSLDSLGEAGKVGERALRRGRDEISLLAKAGRQAPVTAEILADLLRDLDDPRRAVEINDLVAGATGRTDERAGTRDTMGYTGLEGLLNYPYYQSLALNQFDQIGHLLHFGLYEVYSGPCGSFSSGRDPETGEPGVPKDGGGTTTQIEDLAKCATWLGPNQPGINEDLNLPKYHPSVCPEGTAPEHARIELCDPGDPASANTKRTTGKRKRKGGERSSRAPGADPQGGSPTAPGNPGLPLPGVPDLGELPSRLDPSGPNRNAAQDLLDFLFKP